MREDYENSLSKDYFNSLYLKDLKIRGFSEHFINTVKSAFSRGILSEDIEREIQRKLHESII